MFNAVPTGFQEEALLRVHAFGFARRDVEKQRIEAVEVVQSAQPAAIGLARGRFARLIVLVDAPALGRDLGNAIAPFRDVAPELVERARLRELAGHANDGDRLRRR